MKVISHGTGQQGWAKEFTCTGEGNKGGGCGAILLVEAGDMFRTTSHCRDETETFTTFECCECGVWTDIDSKAVPQYVLNGLKHRSPNRQANDDSYAGYVR